MEQEIFDSDGDGTLKIEYADCFRIGHSAHKFVLDFGQVSPDAGERCYHTRVITGPDGAKDFFRILGEAIIQYEEKLGPIVEQ